MLNWNFQNWKSRGVLTGSAAVIAAGVLIWLLAGPRGTVPQGFTALNASMAQTIEGTKPVTPAEKPSSPSSSSSAKGEAKEDAGAGSKQAGAEETAAGAAGSGAEQAPASAPKGAGAEDKPAQGDQRLPAGGGNGTTAPGAQESEKSRSGAVVQVPDTSTGGEAKTSPTDKQPPSGPLIDINTANLQQLMELPGIGESKGKAILAYRERHGKFKRAEQLLDIKGIGEKMLAKMKPYLQISP